MLVLRFVGIDVCGSLSSSGVLNPTEVKRITRLGPGYSAARLQRLQQKIVRMAFNM